MPIKILLNGENATLDTDMMLSTAIEQWQLTPHTFAIALDGIFIPRADYPSTQLTEGSRVEIVTAMQGG